MRRQSQGDHACPRGYPTQGRAKEGVSLGIEVEDSQYWVTAAENAGHWHLGVQKGVEKFKDVRRRDDLRRSNPRHKPEVVASGAGNGRAPTAGLTTAAIACEDSSSGNDGESDRLRP